PPKVPNARLERARATVGSVVWIRAEVEKIGEDLSMSGECRALKHASEIVRRRWLQFLQNVDIAGKTCLGHRGGVPLRVLDVVNIVKSWPARARICSGPDQPADPFQVAFLAKL